LTVRALAGRLDGWLDRRFPEPERGARLRAVLADRFGSDERPVTAETCREIEAVAHGFSRHLELEFHADGSLVPADESPGWPPAGPAEVAARAGQVGEVSRREDGIGVFALDGLDDVRWSGPFLEAAFALLRGASGVVLDLRANGGGDPGALTLALGWLLGGGAPVHVSDVLYRDRTRQWWTAGRPPERSLPPDTPLAVLVGPRTFSSGEALAYHLQVRRRARVFGERTPGAADHVTPVALTPHVRGILPEGVVRDAVSRANWEGAGVVPDIACPAADALQSSAVAISATTA
jgi:hypothetical protein